MSGYPQRSVVSHQIMGTIKFISGGSGFNTLALHVNKMILSFQTDMPGQTVQTQIRLHSICIVWTHNSMVEPHRSNFRVITTIFFGCLNI